MQQTTSRTLTRQAHPEGMWDKRAWRAALLTGLISGTFSTIVVTLGAGRIGRSAPLDWMEIATAYFGPAVISEQPTWYAILGGLFVHQSADLFWVLVFFGLLGRWTRTLTPSAVLLLAIPWAVLTSALEYFAVLPWLQPIVPMQVPYWTALTVHLTSGFAYPVFGWLRTPSSFENKQYLTFGRNWMTVLIGLSSVFAILYGLGKFRHELSLPVASNGRLADQKFLRHMTAHHEVGVSMSKLAAERAPAPEMRILGRLMVAGQQAEINVMRSWWQSWYGSQMPGITSQEWETMPGMPSKSQLRKLTELQGHEFQSEFVRQMVMHHEGAIIMSRETWGSRGDLRIWPLADSIIHTQTRQIDRLTRFGSPAPSILSHH